MDDHSIGYKMINWTQGNHILRDLDAISGGLLGTAIFTAAALALTAQVGANYIKEHLPVSFVGMKKKAEIRLFGNSTKLMYSLLTLLLSSFA